MCVQLANKQDWARYHSYEVHQMAELVDSHMRPGPWQKVGYFRKVRIPVPATITFQMSHVNTIRPCRLEGPLLITPPIHS